MKISIIEEKNSTESKYAMTMSDDFFNSSHKKKKKQNIVHQNHKKRPIPKIDYLKTLFIICVQNTVYALKYFNQTSANN